MNQQHQQSEAGTGSGCVWLVLRGSANWQDRAMLNDLPCMRIMDRVTCKAFWNRFKYSTVLLVRLDNY